MAQFDVYKNLNPNSNEKIPYILDVQNDILKSLSSRVVVPLALNISGAKILNPSFEIENNKVTMSTAELSSIPLSMIGDKVCTLKNKRDEVIGAIDF